MQQLLNDCKTFVVGLNLIRLWRALVIRYDAKDVNYDQILVRVAAPDTVAVEFTLQTSLVHQSDVQYSGGPDSNRGTWGPCKYRDVRGANDSAFGKGFSGLVALDAVLDGGFHFE